MSGISLLPVFVIGLLGGIHCIGMCGGIVSAFSMAGGQRRTIPIAVAHSPQSASSAALDKTARVLSYNLGRIGTYAILGAIGGGLAGSGRAFVNLAAVETVGYWLANFMLILLGLHLMSTNSVLLVLERGGQVLWRRIQPATRYFLPMDTPLKAVALGSLWGMVPCGMVYSVLLTAMLSGSATSGAAVMLAFGLGTLPVLLGAGLLGASLQSWTPDRKVRRIGGAIVLIFGVLGLIRAANGLSLGWLDSFCVTPVHGGLL
ncbi:hypothetical protein EDC30_101382 [Paucimonas lemoignei]|uniref:Urease accessory protein UreH-like transmembrane domain-containing protein n=1 Tax=Paucimonas lemoignei TaxID=29443 RepID=A0A4R3I114_PAULE|nr:sulfite exporter TauE/SafE family protein [Paucimonas lemoignei]TCS39426.1 hypothetical protein EDC30_101382 [Paucimonas lemoignei]